MKTRRGWVLLPGIPAAFALLCAASPGFARQALNGLSQPAMLFLHWVTARVPFPVSEAAALGAASVLPYMLLLTLAQCARRRGQVSPRRRLMGVGVAALALLGGLVLLWAPARALPCEAPPAPDAVRLERLCDELVTSLNASPLRFPDAKAALATAPEVAGPPALAVKAARYPEWMRAMRICGLFVPLTGEALVDADAPAPLVPFTAVHELMHLIGIADEGAANIEAWRRCTAAGGPFADSARLWALRYALGMLGQADAPARLRVYEKMKDPLRQVFHDIHGEANPAARSPAPLSGLAITRGDYGAMVGALCDKSGEERGKSEE